MQQNIPEYIVRKRTPAVSWADSITKCLSFLNGRIFSIRQFFRLILGSSAILDFEQLYSKKAGMPLAQMNG